MKSKVSSFIMSLLMLLLIGIIVIFGLMIYNQIDKQAIVSDVEEFVSNMSVPVAEETLSSIETPTIIESNSSSSLNPTDETINYKNSNIDKYFYNQLDSNSKIIYNAMESNKENMKTGTYEINLGTEFSSLLSQSNGEDLLGTYYQSAIEAYTYDNPDVFYIEYKKLYLNIETTTKGKSVTYKVFINSGNDTNYLTDEFPDVNSVNTAISQIENVKAYFIQNKKSTDYENIKLVHDYLIESIEYDQTISMPNIYNVYGALVNKKCVCEGYAKAFKYIMDGLNIPCTIVSGLATNSQGTTENHAWNYVQINGVWYAIDCTWDDPVIVGGGVATNSQKYKYFLKGSSEFNSTHQANGQFTDNGKVFSFPSLYASNY